MGGMGNGRNADNTAVVRAFHAALTHEAIAVVAVVLAVAFAWRVLRVAQLKAARRGGPGRLATPPGPASHTTEAPARRLLRVGFGLLWVVDGILQLQPAMPLGLVPDVVKPAAASSPAWVREFVAWPSHLWGMHPVAAGAAVVWLQLGLGAWLLSASSGALSRAAGAASATWAMLVWAFGEAFGGIFGTGASWLFGVPGPALLYMLAGSLLALPERHWVGTRLGTSLLRGSGAFFAGMAVLQAWPGRGSWHGAANGSGNGTGGALVAMVTQMVRTPQPRLLSQWLSAFAHFDAAHGFGVNLFVVVALFLVGAGLGAARGAATRWAVAGCVVICMAAWVLVQDLGFLGGVGTDPSTMLPVALLVVSGYTAVARPALPAAQPQQASGWPSGVRERFVTDPAYALRSVAAIGAVAVMLIGLVPVAVSFAGPAARPSGAPGASAVNGAHPRAS